MKFSSPTWIYYGIITVVLSSVYHDANALSEKFSVVEEQQLHKEQEDEEGFQMMERRSLIDVEGECRLQGASYGIASSNGIVHEWAPLVGIACNGKCYSYASVWSDVAIRHGDNPVTSEGECADLCRQENECDVWTYWPPRRGEGEGSFCELFATAARTNDHVIEYTTLTNLPPSQRQITAPQNCGNTTWLPFMESILPPPVSYDQFEIDYNSIYESTGRCDYCPSEWGFEIIPGKTYYDEESREITKCDDVYNYFILGYVDMEEIGVSCSDIASYYQSPDKCCRHISQKKEEEKKPVIYDVTEGFCNICPDKTLTSSNTALKLLSDKTYYEGGRKKSCDDFYKFVKIFGVAAGGKTCEESAFWFQYEVKCCVMEEEEEDTIEEGDDYLAPDGRSCWVREHSYGVKADGACDDADIIAIYTENSTFELGVSQGWWNDEKEEDVEVHVYHNNDIDIPPMSNVLQCQKACNSNQDCGGWEFFSDSSSPPSNEEKVGTCILKSKLTCTPSLTRSYFAVTSSSRSVVAGIRGCIDADSKNPIEQNSLDTSNIWFQNCDLPRCTKPIYEGSWAKDTYIPDYVDGESCWYKHYNATELGTDCLQNRWIVVNGGSNALSFYIQLVNLLAPVQRNSKDPLVTFYNTIQFSVIDIILAPGSIPILNSDSKDIIYKNMKRFCDEDKSLPCQDSLEFQNGRIDWDDKYVTAIDNILNDNDIPYEPGATRLTLVVGQIWSNSKELLPIIGNKDDTNAWSNSKVIFYAQAMIWYPCRSEGWCNFDELGATSELMFKKYNSDIDNLIASGNTTCATDRFECFFASHAYGGDVIPNKAQKMLEINEQKLGPLPWAHIIDYNGFSPKKEVLDGHVTAALIFPVHSMIWNTVCDGPQYGCPEAIRTTPSCHADCNDRAILEGKSVQDACPVFDTCLALPPSEWDCLVMRQCNVETYDLVPWEIATAVLGNNDIASQKSIVDVNEIKVQNELLISIIDCDRIWCGSSGASWAVSLALIAIGLLIVLLFSMRERFSSPKEKNTKTDNSSNNASESDSAVNNIENTDPETANKSAVSSHSDAISTNNDSTGSRDDNYVQGQDNKSHDAAVSPEVSNNDKNPSAKKEFLKSLGVARLLASQHIVLGHLYAKGEGIIASSYFFSWGFTWVPWFFMLSGYVLTHARLNSSNPSRVDSPLDHVAKRLSTIFPMYAFGLVLTLILRISRNLRLPRIGILIGQSYLLQSWIPTWTESALLSQCWFLSDLLLYWAVFGYVYKILQKLSLRKVFALLVFISLLPWLIILVPAFSDEISSTWYTSHQWGETDSAIDILTVMLKFHPIFYFHVFVFGMLLAMLRNHIKVDDGSGFVRFLTFFTQFGGMLGYFGLILVFMIRDIRPDAYKLSTRLSILLPLQGIMMLGLSPLPRTLESQGFQDPLAILFSYAPSWIGDMSYCQYVLQFAMYNLYPMKQITNPSFFIYLWGASLICYYTIQDPAAKLWRNFLPKARNARDKNNLPSLGKIVGLLLIPPSILALILGITSAVYKPNSRYSLTGKNITLPPFVRLADEAVDIVLDWTIVPDDENDNTSVTINPSILFVKGDNGKLQWIRAVRAHSFEDISTNGTFFNGSEVAERIFYFKSSIMIRSEPFLGDLTLGFDDDNIANWGLNGSLPLESIDQRIISHKAKKANWTNICEPEAYYDNQQNSLNRKLVTGPEDPKLVEYPTFTRDGNSLTSWGITFSSLPPASLLSSSTSAHECKWKDEAVMQMYWASGGEALNVGEKIQGIHMKCGKPTSAEKNWIAFHYGTKLYYIYSIEPHRIMHVRQSDGSCVQQHITYSKELQEIAGQVDAIRGSATAMLYSNTEYLALMHTTDANGYITIAYTFESKPPFAVKRISRPLPLHSRAFASSLTLFGDKVLIGYGENDERSRMLVMSRNHLETMFRWPSS